MAQTAENTRALRALRDLLDQVETLDDYTLTRDLEQHEAEACWDEAQREARAVLDLAKTEA